MEEVPILDTVIKRKVKGIGQLLSIYYLPHDAIKGKVNGMKEMGRIMRKIEDIREKRMPETEERNAG